MKTSPPRKMETSEFSMKERVENEQQANSAFVRH
jgi:hypothetical protein